MYEGKGDDRPIDGALRRILNTNSFEELESEIQGLGARDFFTEEQAKTIGAHMAKLAARECANLEGVEARSECMVNLLHLTKNY